MALVSDHNPILLTTKFLIHVPRLRSFKFENGWLMERDLKMVVNRYWSGFSNWRLTDCLAAMADTLDLFGNSRDSEFWVGKIDQFPAREDEC
ncbi:hypothetical protein ACS0TY_004548 [Phlomoides rotata]